MVYFNIVNVTFIFEIQRLAKISLVPLGYYQRNGSKIWYSL